MPKIKQLDFAGQTIFCGIDVHKKNWRVNIRNDQFELEDYTQDPFEDLLMKHLHKKYPGAHYQVAYEAGFSGFELQRSLTIFRYKLHSRQSSRYTFYRPG